MDMFATEVCQQLDNDRAKIVEFELFLVKLINMELRY